MTTRTMGILAPPVRRNTVCRGERLLSVKVNSNPLCASPEVVATCTLVSASSTSWDTGTGIAGPIIKVRWMPLSIGRSWYSFRQRDTQPAAGSFGQLIGTDRRIGVAQPPELLRVAEVLHGEQVQSIALCDGVFLQYGEPFRGRDEAAAQIRNGLSIRRR